MLGKYFDEKDIVRKYVGKIAFSWTLKNKVGIKFE